MDQNNNPSRESLLEGFALGEWVVRPLSGCFERDGQTRHVEPKLMDVLLCLAERPGEVISRDKLVENAWKDLVVSEEVLTRAISELRTLLGDTQRVRSYIRTIPKRGYSLLEKPIPLDEVSSLTDSEDQVDAPDSTAKPYIQTLDQNSVAQPAEELAATLSAVRQFSHDFWAPVFKSIVTVGLPLIGLGVVIGLLLTDRDATAPSPPAVTSKLPEQIDENKTVVARPFPEIIETPNRLGFSDPSVPSLAVMPFVETSSDESSQNIGQGLSEDIRNALIRVQGINVVARTTSERFKDLDMGIREIGEQLNVDSLIEGSVRTRGDQSRITIQLTDTQTGYPVWSGTYDHDINDIFATQTKISKDVVEQVAPQLLKDLANGKRPQNPIAYNEYVLGRHVWHQRTKESLEKAEAHFKKAIEADKNYAPPYAALSDTYMLQLAYAERDKDEVLQLARVNAKKALSLDPYLAEAHTSIAEVYELAGDLEASEKSFLRSIELDPKNSMTRLWYAGLLHKNDQLVVAFEQYKKAFEIDPLHPVIQFAYLHSLAELGFTDEVLNTSKEMFSFSEEERLLPIMFVGMLGTGRYQEFFHFVTEHQFNEKNITIARLYLAMALSDFGHADQVRRLLDIDPKLNLGSALIEIEGRLNLQMRDSGKFRKSADRLLETISDIRANQFQKNVEECVKGRRTYWLGIANFIDNKFDEAAKTFNKAKGDGFLQCHMDEDTRISLLLYEAASLKKTKTNKRIVKDLLAQTENRLETILDSGFNAPAVQSSMIGLLLLKEDQEGLETFLAKLDTYRINPWVSIASHPFFDEYLSDPEFIRLTNPMRTRFEESAAFAASVDLKRFGVED